MAKDIKNPETKSEQRVAVAAKPVEKPVEKPEVKTKGNTKVKVIAGFYDIKADVLRHVGEEFTCAAERANELIAKQLVEGSTK